MNKYKEAKETLERYDYSTKLELTEGTRNNITSGITVEQFFVMKETCIELLKEKEMEWLMWEFTEEEKTILRNIDDKWKWIARDETGSLFLYNAEPYKLENHWTIPSNTYAIIAIINIFKHLFQSVQWSDKEPCEFRKYL